MPAPPSSTDSASSLTPRATRSFPEKSGETRYITWLPLPTMYDLMASSKRFITVFIRFVPVMRFCTLSFWPASWNATMWQRL